MAPRKRHRQQLATELPIFSDGDDDSRIIGKSIPSNTKQTISSLEIAELTGKDFSRLLTHSAAQNDIDYGEIMLEPKELGARVGLSALAVNRLLAAHGIAMDFDR